jgi:mono/diheme cytochrome c family protein
MNKSPSSPQKEVLKPLSDRCILDCVSSLSLRIVRQQIGTDQRGAIHMQLTLRVVLTSMVSMFALVVLAQDAAVEEGKKIYTAQKCQVCHSIAGVGNKKSPLDGVGKKLSAEDIKKWIVSPKEMKSDTKMKAYPNLPAKELDALVAYLASLKS